MQKLLNETQAEDLKIWMYGKLLYVVMLAIVSGLYVVRAERSFRRRCLAWVMAAMLHHAEGVGGGGGRSSSGPLCLSLPPPPQHTGENHLIRSSLDPRPFRLFPLHLSLCQSVTSFFFGLFIALMLFFLFLSQNLSHFVITSDWSNRGFSAVVNDQLFLRCVRTSNESSIFSPYKLQGKCLAANSQHLCAQRGVFSVVCLLKGFWRMN